jgi:ParB family chromosome partitioning protein
VVTTDDRRVRFVGVDAYTTAGGALTRDLFSDVAVIEDFPLLERLFAEKVDATRAKFLERGWAWAEFVDGTYLPYGIGAGMERRYSELSTAQRAVCGVFFFVSVDGVCDMGKDSRTWAGGFIRREDRARAIEAGVLSPPPEAEAPGTGDDAATDPGAGFSAALLADLRAIRLHAFHEAMLENRDTALELIAYALSPCSGLAQGLLDVSVRAQKNAPDNADGFDGDPRLGSGPASAAPVPWADRVVADPESKIAAALVPALTYGLSHGASDPDRMALFRDFEQQLGTDMRAFWTPTRENFFARVPAAVLEAIYAQIFALAPADEDARAFARMKKGAKANLLHMLFNGDEKTRRAYRLMTDDAMARISAWTPEFD